MKYAILKISPTIFIEICKYSTNTVNIKTNKIPEDAKYVRSFYEDNSGWGMINLVLESDLFDDIEEGNVIPILPNPIFEYR